MRSLAVACGVLLLVAGSPAQEVELPAPPGPPAGLAGVDLTEADVQEMVRTGAKWLAEQHLTPRMDDIQVPLVALALFHADIFTVHPELKPVAEQMVDILCRRKLLKTYDVALTAMALAEWDPVRYRWRIGECARWLLENLGRTEQFPVWGYGRMHRAMGGLRSPDQPLPTEPPPMALAPWFRDSGIGGTDNSCTQFAVLGLHAALMAGLELPPEPWQAVIDWTARCQNEDGGFPYRKKGDGSYLSMTCAGVACRTLALHLQGKEPLDDPIVRRGLLWVHHNFSMEQNTPKGRHYQYYSIYGIERVGAMLGVDFIGTHEWYPLGARYLKDHQREDGAWPRDNQSAILTTCFALLFLTKASPHLKTEPLPPAPGRIRVMGPDRGADELPVDTLLLILDASYSMEQGIGGETKMAIAKGVLRKVAGQLPPGLTVGLRVYGARDPRDCTDSELVIPLGPADPEALVARIEQIEPTGMTPLAHSLTEAGRDLAGADGRAVIILLTDGEETCRGTPSEAVRQLRAQGIDATVQVRGFDVSSMMSVNQLADIAEAGGGRYLPAGNARELEAALEELFGRFVPPVFQVELPTGEVVATGAVDGEGVKVMPGSYRVRVGQRALFDPVEVPSRGSVTLTIR